MISWDAFACLPTSEVLGAVVLSGLAVALGGRIPRPRPRPMGALARDETATATLDFILVFPLFMMVVLVLVQLALLINARLVVSYAAFAATRSAVVWLEDGEEVAATRAERAAEIGCLPISPGGLGPATGMATALPVAPLYFHDLSLSSSFVRRVLRGGSKLGYSRLATTVDIQLPETELGPHDPVTVEVEHAFYLSVPYGNGLFRERGGGPGGVPVRIIRDAYTLTHEGRVGRR